MCAKSENGSVARPRGRPRSDRSRLTRAEVVAAALRISRAEGMAAVSMRRLAQELGVWVAAVGHHIDSKDALLDTVVDEALGDCVLSADSRLDWADRLRAMVRELWALSMRHEGLADHVLRRIHVTMRGPNGRAVGNAVVDIFLAAGLDRTAAMEASVCVQAQLMGAVKFEEAMRTFSTAAPDRAAQWPILAIDDAHNAPVRFDPERILWIGVEHLIRGVEAQLSGRASVSFQDGSSIMSNS